MKSLILYRVNGQAEQLVDWNQINWVEVYKLIRNLQRRIFRARKLGQWKQLRRLQKLMKKLNSTFALCPQTSGCTERSDVNGHFTLYS